MENYCEIQVGIELSIKKLTTNVIKTGSNTPLDDQDCFCEVIAEESKFNTRS